MNCVITGGTKGIGRAIAEIFAKNGFDLAIAARNGVDLAGLKRDFENRYSIQVRPFVVDLSQKKAVLGFADFILSQWEVPDVVVNNAGIFSQGSMLTDPDDHLENMMQINLFSAYHLTRALLPPMLAQGKGHIFNICSVASQQAYPDSSAYTITKFAMLGFSKSLRLELKNQGIKVTSVLPGATLTASWEGIALPPKRLMDAREVAKAVWSAWDMGPSAVVEEIVMRPQLGDL